MALAWPGRPWLCLSLLVLTLAGRLRAHSTNYYPDQEAKEPNLANVDATMCDRIYGENLDLDACSTAIYKMPIGDDLIDFTVPHAAEASPPHSRAAFVPEIYTDAGYQGDTDLGVSQKVQEGLWAWWAVLTSPNESAMRLEAAASIQYLVSRSQDMILNNEGGNWYDSPSDWRADTSTAVPVPNNVKYSCSATLGSPSAPNCEAALYEMQNSGNVLLDPASGPVIHVAGNCAVAVSATRQRYTSWDVIKSATLMLLSQCVADPLSSHVGGVATAQVAHGKGSGRYGAGTRPAVLALGVQIAIYLQDAFTGPAAETCAYGVIANRTGDVGQCHG